jgi:hypothetical protein
MKAIRNLKWVLAAFAFATGGAHAADDGARYSKPLIQPDFARLIPKTYPVIRSRFDALRPTTEPVIHPGVPRVHITESLVHPTDRALLIATASP